MYDSIGMVLKYFAGAISLDHIRAMTIDQYIDLTKMIERNSLLELSGADPSSAATQLAGAMYKGLI